MIPTRCRRLNQAIILILLSFLINPLSFLATAKEETSSPLASVKTTWQQIHAPLLPPLKHAIPKQITLENGLVIFLQPDFELPLVQMTLLIRGGSEDDPPNQVGLAALFGKTWVTGGTKEQNGGQLDAFFESHGVQLQSSVDADSIDLSFQCLTMDFDEILKEVFEILTKPKFQAGQVSLEKDQMMAELVDWNDHLDALSDRESAKIALGAQHPHARQPNFHSIRTLGRKDLFSWHQRYVHPNHLIIGILGSFDTHEMEEKLRKTFGPWPKGPSYQKAEISFAPTKPGIYSIHRREVKQSSIRMVQLGQTRRNPDFYALSVLNEILSGGEDSRLFSNIRTKQGLAYHVDGGIYSGWEYPGLYELSLETSSKNTVRAILALEKEIQQLKEHPPSREEVEGAKASILNAFVFQFENKIDILANFLTLSFYGYPLDWTEKYPERIRTVAEADVQRVIEQYLNPAGFAIVVVGNESDFEKPLSTLGPVTMVDMSVGNH